MPVKVDVVPPPPANSKQPGVTKSLLYNGSRFQGSQKSKGNSYDVEVVLQVSRFPLVSAPTFAVDRAVDRAVASRKLRHRRRIWLSAKRDTMTAQNDYTDAPDGFSSFYSFYSASLSLVSLGFRDTSVRVGRMPFARGTSYAR